MSASQKKTDSGQKYVCGMCGWVYDPALGVPLEGVAPRTPFEELPASFACPVCGAGKIRFSPQA